MNIFRRLSTPTGFVFLQEAHSSGDIEEKGMLCVSSRNTLLGRYWGKRNDDFQGQLFFSHGKANSCLDKFTSSHPIFRGAVSHVQAIRHAKNGYTKPKYVSNQEATGNVAFCTLSPKWDLWFSFLMYFHWKFLQWNFCSLNVLWMSKIRCL